VAHPWRADLQGRGAASFVLRVEPPDAQIVVDGDVWLGTAVRTEIFRKEIELSEGTTIRLNVRLVR
jgi:hypothetical protein